MVAQPLDVDQQVVTVDRRRQRRHGAGALVPPLRRPIGHAPQPGLAGARQQHQVQVADPAHLRFQAVDAGRRQRRHRGLRRGHDHGDVDQLSNQRQELGIVPAVFRRPRGHRLDQHDQPTSRRQLDQPLDRRRLQAHAPGHDDGHVERVDVVLIDHHPVVARVGQQAGVDEPLGLLARRCAVHAEQFGVRGLGRLCAAGPHSRWPMVSAHTVDSGYSTATSGTCLPADSTVRSRPIAAAKAG